MRRRLSELSPDIPVSTLADTVGAINKAQLTESYREMYDMFFYTGVLDQATLRSIAEVTGCRFISVLKLAAFRQQSTRRFSLFGARIVETKRANIRMSWQIWDSRDGSIAWVVKEELGVGHDTTVEKPISLESMAQQTAENLISRLP